MMRRNINLRPAKHVPQRTCLACRKVRPKRELVRLVRLPDGSVEVDTRGKSDGRGTYLCPAVECWKAGLKGERLAHALRTTLSPENRKWLVNYGEGFLQGVS